MTQLEQDLKKIRDALDSTFGHQYAEQHPELVAEIYRAVQFKTALADVVDFLKKSPIKVAHY